jgi:hypothetical protein
MRGAMYAFGTHERNPSGNASDYDDLALSFAADHIGARKVPRCVPRRPQAEPRPRTSARLHMADSLPCADALAQRKRRDSRAIER